MYFYLLDDILFRNYPTVLDIIIGPSQRFHYCIPPPLPLDLHVASRFLSNGYSEPRRHDVNPLGL